MFCFLFFIVVFLFFSFFGFLVCFLFALVLFCKKNYETLYSLCCWGLNIGAFGPPSPCLIILITDGGYDGYDGWAHGSHGRSLCATSSTVSPLIRFQLRLVGHPYLKATVWGESGGVRYFRAMFHPDLDDLGQLISVDFNWSSGRVHKCLAICKSASIPFRVLAGFLESFLRLGQILTTGQFWQKAAGSPAGHPRASRSKNMATRRKWLPQKCPIWKTIHNYITIPCLEYSYPLVQFKKVRIGETWITCWANWSLK